MMEWQPIEALPDHLKNDGVVVDVWVVPFHGKPHRRTDMWWLQSKKWSGWRGGKCHIMKSGYPVGDFVGSDCHVTHWMPSPPAPKATE
ncbi:hypothetical protein phiGT1_64 [Sulfitobacter phage phiGT1]|nr:hypothetical protein phiGT1_64 [Sulfitobacter phage phiGT1]